jgi:hypothetical protein
MFRHGASMAFVAGQHVVPAYKKLDVWCRRRSSACGAEEEGCDIQVCVRLQVRRRVSSCSRSSLSQKHELMVVSCASVCSRRTACV